MNWQHERHITLWAEVSQRLPTYDVAHDLQHVLRVTRWCIHIAEVEGEDSDLAGAAGMVHDLVWIPKDHAHRPLSSTLAAAIAPELLTPAGYSAAEQSAIVEAVRTCSWSSGQAPTSMLGKILQDADRIDAIGAIGALRNAAVAQTMAQKRQGVHLAHPDDPTVQTVRTPNDREYALDHWPVKLFRLAEGMHTATGKAEGMRRHDRLRTMYAWLDEELRPPLAAAPPQSCLSPPPRGQVKG